MFDNLQQDLLAAFSSVEVTRAELYGATEVLEKSKQIFEGKKALAIYNGEIEGKNVEQREASTAILLNQELDELGKAESVYRKARYEHDLATYNLSRVKAILRLIEAEARLTSIKVE
ncbi:MAG: hypothetical protein ACXABN_17940 [Candidatus Thorarchaeota archaeon]|jgi:hypothetical protein